MLYCGKCGYNFAVLPLTQEIEMMMKERTREVPNFDPVQLWSFVRYVPKPEWVE